MNDDPNLFDLPVLPYAGTSGHSGSAASAERARRDDRDGTTTRRQRQVIDHLARQAVYGATWKDLAAWYRWHHGQASGALSVLHKAGAIVRLVERRDRCHIYVLPNWVDGREVDEYRQTITRTQIREHLATLEELMDVGRYQEARAFVDALRHELG